jgi:nucleoside-diphosphate-sugar epimerase
MKMNKEEIEETSTSEIYGCAEEIPTSEEYRGNVNPIGPRSCYDEAKRCGESYVIAFRGRNEGACRVGRERRSGG